jgi:ATP-dependent DNA helicase RecQ
MFGMLARWTQKSISELIAQLEDQGLLIPLEKDGFRLLRLSTTGQEWLKTHPHDMTAAMAPEPRAVTKVTASQTRPQTKELTGYDRVLFERLRAWRLETAPEMNKPPFIVFHDKVLKRIATSCPTTEQELADIKGIGPRKLEQYGPAVLEIVASHQEGSSPGKR